MTFLDLSPFEPAAKPSDLLGQIVTAIAAKDVITEVEQGLRERLQETLNDLGADSLKVKGAGTALWAGGATTARVSDADAHAAWCDEQGLPYVQRTEVDTARLLDLLAADDELAERLSAAGVTREVPTFGAQHTDVLVEELTHVGDQLVDGNGEAVPGVRLSRKAPVFQVRTDKQARERIKGELSGRRELGGAA